MEYRTAWGMPAPVPADERMPHTAVFGWQEYGATTSNPALYNHFPNYSNNNKSFQTAPPPADCDYRITQSAHTGGMQAMLGDASVRSVTSSISLQTWIRACDPRDNQPLGNDW